MAKDLVLSPFGIKIIKDLFRISLKKDFMAGTHDAEIIKINENFAINNKLFLLSSKKKCSMLAKYNLNVQTETFESNQELVTAVKKWVHTYGHFQQLTPEKYIGCTGLLINVCMYKGTWNDHKENLMTVYNSFNYTEDIKYEPRILVVPTSDEGVLLAIVVPKKHDVSTDLAVELKERGLTAALNSINPAFTVTCKQPVPMFAFESAIELQSSTNEATVTQYGEIRTDERGLHVKVLTCLPVKDEKINLDHRTPPTSGKCLNFAVIYKDIPIFTGQVLP